MEWTGQVYADSPVVAVQILIGAPPERVWDLVSDIGLMAELSPELQGVAWLDGATGPAAGHRFTGRNAHPAMGEWETVSTVTECDPPRRFAWAVGDLAGQLQHLRRQGGQVDRHGHRRQADPHGLGPFGPFSPGQREGVVPAREADLLPGEHLPDDGDRLTHAAQRMTERDAVQPLHHLGP